jgi:membrane protein
VSEKRSIEQIEADLRRTREDLSATVGELAGRLAPKALAGDAKNAVRATAEGAKEAVKTRIREVKDRATALVADAKNGDTTAIGILACVSTAVIGYITLKAARRGY